MRKIIALLVSVVFLFNCTSFTVDAERTDVQKGIDFLLERGYSYEEIINTFPEDDLEIISTATGLTRSETCYEVSESGKVVREVNNKKSTYNIVPGQDTESTSGGKLTQTVSAFSLNDKKMLVTYTFKWNDTPVNLKTDCCAVLFDGAKLENVRSAYYQYTSRNLASGSDNTVTVNRPTSTSSGGVGIDFKFVKDSTHAGGIKDHQNYNHRGYISCIATITSGKCINVWSRYYHQEGKLSLSPSISIDGVSVSLSNTLQMVLMNPNPYVSCKVN